MPSASSRLAWSHSDQLALATALDQAIRCSAALVPRPSGTDSAPEGGGHDTPLFNSLHQAIPAVAAALQLQQHSADNWPDTSADTPLEPAALEPAALESDALESDALVPHGAHCLPPLGSPTLPPLLERLSALLNWLSQPLPSVTARHDLPPPNSRRPSKSNRKSPANDDSPATGDSPKDLSPHDRLPLLWNYLETATPPGSSLSQRFSDPTNQTHASSSPAATASDAAPVAASVAAADSLRCSIDPACPSLQAGLIARVTLLQERLVWSHQLEQEKLASLKRLAYGASHEINNPLANIATRAQTLLPSETNLQRRQTLQTINAQAFRAFDMLANLMHYASPPPHRPQRVDLVALVTQNVAALRRQLANPAHPIELQLPDVAMIANVDPHQFGVLVQALARNAVEAVAACPATAAIIVRLGSHTSPAGHTTVVLEVLDDGHSPAPESLPFLCDPFYSGREAGRGLGFGLAKALRIVEAHKGHLTWLSRQPAGFHIRALLPQPE